MKSEGIVKFGAMGIYPDSLAPDGQVRCLRKRTRGFEDSPSARVSAASKSTCWRPELVRQRNGFMPTADIRNLILLAPIFDPGVRTMGYGPASIMKKVPELLEWSLADVQGELSKMHEEGLVEQFTEQMPDSWKSTAAGRAARESLARQHAERARCLCSPTIDALDDLMLGLAATADICSLGHSHPPTELRLSDYLYDFKGDIAASIARLHERGLVKLQQMPGLSRQGRSLYITVDGLREYRSRVAAKLGVDGDTCILDSQPMEVAVNDRLSHVGLSSDLVANLSARFDEAERCDGVQAYLAATVLYGSILEGLLEGLANLEPQKANSSPACPKAEDGKPKKFSEWKFSEWIAVAKDVGWIPRSVGGYADQLRSSRNLVHVSKQLRDEVHADKHLASITRSVLDAVLEHIAEARMS